MTNLAASRQQVNTGIKHAFSCINILQVPKQMLKTEGKVQDFLISLERPGESECIEKQCLIIIVAQIQLEQSDFDKKPPHNALQ